MFDRTLFPAAHLDTPLPPVEYHCHTLYSDGTATMREVVRAAMDRGIVRLIITEHTEPELVDGHDWFGRYADELYALREEFSPYIDLVLGIEAPALDFDGTLLLTEAMERQAEFVLAAVHAYPTVGWNLERLPPRRAVELEFRTLMGLARNPRVDALAHPGGVCSTYVTPFPMELFEEVVATATATGMAIEMNPAYQIPMAPYLAICRKHGALLSPGSNAHQPEDLGKAWQGLRDLANW